MKTLRTCFLTLATLAVACYLGACVPGAGATSQEQAAPGSPPIGSTQWVILVDVSRSIAAGDIPPWEKHLTEMLEQFQPGDTILILPMGVRSADAGALLQLKTDPLDRDRGLSAFTAAKWRLDELKLKAKAAFHDALAKRASSGTDIFGALARIPAGSRLLVFSDMLHSAPDLDMEKRKLRSADLPRFVEQLAKEHRWQNGTLRGVRVWCHLPAVPIDERRRPLNDRATLAEFWRLVLVDRMGATKIEHFDSLGV